VLGLLILLAVIVALLLGGLAAQLHWDHVRINRRLDEVDATTRELRVDLGRMGDRLADIEDAHGGRSRPYHFGVDE
jgi:hypothetical protein